MASKRPYIELISEMTVDGKLTLKRGLSSKIIMGLMDEESQRFLHRKRSEFDAIMVGSNTIRIDNSILTNRLAPGKSPIRVVPSSDAAIPPGANVLNGDAPTIIYVAERADPARVAAIRGAGAETVVCGRERVDLAGMMASLYDRGIARLMDRPHHADPDPLHHRRRPHALAGGRPGRGRDRRRGPGPDDRVLHGRQPPDHRVRPRLQPDR